MTEKLIYEQNQNEPFEKNIWKEKYGSDVEKFFTSGNGKYLTGNFVLFETNYMSSPKIIFHPRNV